MLAGYKTKYTVWPLVAVLLVATLTVVIPSVVQSPSANAVNLLFHLVGIGALVSGFMTGPGAIAAD